MRLGALLAGSVLLTNIIVLAVASTSYPHQQAGIVTLQVGSCEKARQAGRWIHLAINILSTALLGASNYAMQVLSAPTRKEVDKAHSRGHALDIGIQSFTNIFRTSGKRAILWIILACSSIPLHLMSVYFGADPNSLAIR